MVVMMNLFDMSDTLLTVVVDIDCLMMHMYRRQYHHWQISGQQYDRRNMSQETVHLSGCKSTTFSSIRQSLFSSEATFQQHNIFLSAALLNIKTMAKIKTYYFSPTGGTLLVARHLAETLGRLLHADVEYHSYTLPREREELPQFDADDIILWATPVYAGRIPNKTLDFVRTALTHSSIQALKQSSIKSIALVTFGNRAYDNALAELVGLMEDGGMKPVGAAAMVTRHSFSDTLGAGRPNEEDLAALDRFADQLAERIGKVQKHLHNQAITQSSIHLKVPGETHPEKYYTPLKTNNAPAGFLKAKPSCDPDRCTRCDKCTEVCPMGSIGKDCELPTFSGICIKCQACRRICPTGAISFNDPEYHSHVTMIEHTFATPKEPEFYVIDKQ